MLSSDEIVSCAKTILSAGIFQMPTVLAQICKLGWRVLGDFVLAVEGVADP